MRLLVTTASPYARKARAAVIELGLGERIDVEALPIRMPQQAKPDVEAVNPLGKVPALILDDGRTIVDSPVIIAYLDQLAGDRLIPAGEDKWRALTLEALADGCMDAGFVIRVEQMKGETRRDVNEIAAYQGKIARTLDLIEAEPHWLSDRFNVGQLALVCAIDWMIFRDLFPDPLGGRPRLAEAVMRFRQRPSLQSTQPSA